MLLQCLQFALYWLNTCLAVPSAVLVESLSELSDGKVICDLISELQVNTATIYKQLYSRSTLRAAAMAQAPSQLAANGGVRPQLWHAGTHFHNGSFSVVLRAWLNRCV